MILPVSGQCPHLPLAVLSDALVRQLLEIDIGVRRGRLTPLDTLKKTPTGLHFPRINKNLL
jgi:hypothetical protein